MDFNEITDILKEVKFPGYSRNIVSFGIVKDIEIENDSIIILINLDNSEHQCVLEKEIIDIISKRTAIKQIKVNFVANENINKSSHGNQTSIPGIKHTIAVASGKGGVG